MLERLALALILPWSNFNSGSLTELYRNPGTSIDESRRCLLHLFRRSTTLNTESIEYRSIKHHRAWGTFVEMGAKS